jgi:arsenite oxidase large subunit
VVNNGGNHSIRGGTLGQKCFNPNTKTSERLQQPMIRVNGKLTPVSWDLATEAMADISKYVIAKHGEHAWAIKMYSYQYFENTYAITKLGMTSVGTPSSAPTPTTRPASTMRASTPSRRATRTGRWRTWHSFPVSIPTRPRPRCSPSG